MNWAALWRIVLLVTLIGYSLLVLVTTIGGVQNIKDLFKDLKQ